MSMEEKIKLTKQQIKTEENRKKLLSAMEYIMAKYDYNTLTIRNICKVAEVSYGSFYNLYDSKEDFLLYYLTHDFTGFMEERLKTKASFEQLNSIEKCIELFKICAEYNLKKGYLFISGFYSPVNYSLSPIGHEDGTAYSFTPLAKKSYEYLEKAKQEGILNKDLNINDIVNHFCYLFNGITFNWCVSKGQLAIVELVETAFGGYLKLVNQ